MINKETDNIRILKLMEKTNMPVGAIYISGEINIPQASVGRLLKELEENKFIEKISNKGRILTNEGRNYLQKYREQKSKIDIAMELVNSYEKMDKSTLIEILEIRKLIEVKSIELACKNRTDEQLLDLELILKQHINEIYSERLGNEQDLKLHLKIAEMSNNKTLYYLCNLLLTEKNAYTYFSIVTSDIKLAQINHHEMLVKAIKEQDVEGGKLAIEEHIDKIIADVEKNFE